MVRPDGNAGWVRQLVMGPPRLTKVIGVMVCSAI